VRSELGICQLDPEPVEGEGSAVRGRLASAKAVLAAIALAALLSAPALAESGAETYKAHCSACHGAKGAGDTMLGRNLKLRSLGSSEVQDQSDDQLIAITGKGKNKMPRYDNKLSKEQIREVVKYIRSLKQ
jgi:mono/diheme cytochrome c family protein